MAKYFSRVKQRLNRFPVWKLEHVPKDSNEKANALASVAASLPITENHISAYLLSVKFIDCIPAGKPCRQGPPVLDGPHHIVSKHRTNPNGDEQGPQASNSSSHIFLDRWATVQTILGRSVSKVTRTKPVRAS